MSRFAWPSAIVATAVIAFLAGRLTAPARQALSFAAPAEEVPVVAAVPPPAAPPVVPDDFAVNVTKAEISGAYSLKGAFGSRAYQVDSPCLVVYFEMKNNSANRKYDSGGWPSGQLSDEFGNQYRLITDDHAARPDKIPSVLRPGETLRDVLVFEPPLPQAKRLTLELQDHFSSATGPPRSSVAIEIPVATIINAEKTPLEKRGQ